MNKGKAADNFLFRLQEDSDRSRGLAADDMKEEEKRRIIRSLMNIRMPKSVGTELLEAQDAYLQETLLQKGTVSLFDIPNIKEQYGSRHIFAEKLSVWQGDITRLKAGAIVNAANAQMLGCFVPCHGCIDNAIHSSAGMLLREECHQIMQQRRREYGNQYEEPVGTATITNAYNLPCDRVIHTVGPIVYGGLTDSLRQDLRKCYESVLACCVENHIRSVAFCCISTGEFHFPNEEAAEIAVHTVTEFLTANAAFPMERIIFNVFKDRDRQIYETLLRGKDSVMRGNRNGSG